MNLKDSGHNTRLVFSTESGKLCPLCGKQPVKCKCKRKAPVFSGDGTVRVERSTRGRKGKGVSLISGLALEEPLLKALAKKLKQKCGTGGTIKNGTIEIQGDHRDLLVDELNTLGYTAKKAGG